MSTDGRRFWDAHARKNAAYYVDNRMSRHATDMEAFWRGGEEAVGLMVSMTGLEIRGDEEIADIGCGVGRTTRALARRVDRVHGVDISGEMLARARELNGHLENVDWHLGDGHSLALFGDASLDGCFSHVVFQHIPDPDITLGYVREIGRVLRPGGWALFQLSTDPGVHRPRPRDRVLRLVRPGYRAWLGSAVDPARLREVAAAAGLEIEQLLDEGNQYTTVLARRAASTAR